MTNLNDHTHQDYNEHSQNELPNPTDQKAQDQHNQKPHTDHSQTNHDTDHSHGNSAGFGIKDLTRPISAFGFLVLAVALESLVKMPVFVFVPFFLVAYSIVGFPVLKSAFRSIQKGNWFDENTLMSIATIAALGIGAYSEAVAVMLFYATGEAFQDWAISKSKSSIKSLLDIRPKEALVLRDGQLITVDSSDIKIDEIIEIKNGQKVPLDGVLLSDQSSFDTVALTGESKPKTLRENQEVMAGMVNLTGVIRVKVTKVFADSSLS